MPAFICLYGDWVQGVFHEFVRVFEAVRSCDACPGLQLRFLSNALGLFVYLIIAFLRNDLVL